MMWQRRHLIVELPQCVFFVSSRRRHTRYWRDWSSDVCSSDLTLRIKLPGGTLTSGKVFFKSAEADFATQRDVSRSKRDIKRSEERRVGKECRCMYARYDEKKERMTKRKRPVRQDE